MKGAWVLLAASGLLGAEYRAGVARVGNASAVAIEDARGGRVAIAAGGVSELIAARVAKQYGMERARLVLISGGADADSMVAAIGGALGDLRPAELRFGSEAGVAVLEVNGLVVLGTGTLAGGGRRVRGPIRAGFQVVEFGRALSSGGPEVRTVSFVQAVRFGKDLTLVTVGGGPPRIEREVTIAGPPEVQEALGRLMRRLGAR